jgi:hypothetical protein
MNDVDEPTRTPVDRPADPPLAAAWPGEPAVKTLKVVPTAVPPSAATSLKLKVFLGSVAVGVVYGLVTYFAFRRYGLLASYAYLVAVPAAIGAVPLLFRDVDQIRSYAALLVIPWLSILGIFVALGALLKEGALCFLVLGAPFALAAMLGTLIAAVVASLVIRSKKRKALGAAMMILPLAFVGLEQRWLVRQETVAVRSSTVVEAPAEEVFDQLAVIDPISEDEYPAGILNRLGVPRPIAATTDVKAVGGHRVGSFERGLRFDERITAYDRPERMTFDITVDPSQLEPTSTPRHALEGGYFRFVDATYRVERAGAERCTVTLTSRYVAKSSVNAYEELWASAVVGDFQDRVLRVLAGRFGRWHREGRPVPVASRGEPR